MADTKVSAETLVSEVKANHKMYIVCDTGAAPDSNAARMSQVKEYLEITSPPQGRLTVASGTPVPTTDDTGNTTMYYAPYVGRLVPLYDGTRFVMTDIGGELSQLLSDTGESPAAGAAASVYDMYVWLKNGSPVLSRARAWESATARDTGNAIARIEGIYLNNTGWTNGPSAQRATYVGTILTDAASAEVTDAEAFRHVWNMYNRVNRPMFRTDTTNSWNYSTQTWRQVNGSTANQLSFVRGIDEEAVNVEWTVPASNSTSTARTVRSAIGLDSTTTPATKCGIGFSQVSSSIISSPSTTFQGLPGIGKHFLAALEWGEGTDTQTFYGQSGSSPELRRNFLGGLQKM